MNLSEAKQNAKDLNETLTVLIAATEGIKDSDFAALQKRKDALEAAIADTQKRLGEASTVASDKIAKAQADADMKLKELDNQIKTAESALIAARNEAVITRETMRESIANERASLLQERQRVISGLDAQIATKTKTLADMNAAIDAGRARFA